jgi:hypothetical protein
MPDLHMVICKRCKPKFLSLGGIHLVNIDYTLYTLLLKVRDCQDNQNIGDCISAPLLLFSEEVMLECMMPGLDVVVSVDRTVCYG